MGSLSGNAGAIAAFTGQPFPNGLDLGRCVIQFDLGIFVADPAATILAGQLVTKTSAGIALSDGTTSGSAKGVLGIAKWNKANALYSAVVDEAVVLVGTTASNLKHPSLLGASNTSNSLKVSLTPGGAPLTVTTDYTCSITNGTVTRVALGAIADGATVYCSYTFLIQNTDLDFQGRNFWNFLDDVTIQDGHITVLTGWTMLFTTQYDTHQQYAMGDTLYASIAADACGIGYFTNVSGGHNIVVGTVIQVPTATDPYLGLIKSS